MHRIKRDHPRQLPLGFGQDDGYAFEDLVVGRSNAAAVQLLTAWPAWPSPVVVLCGPAGSGKTHLARVWAVRSGALELPRDKIGASLAPVGRAALIEDLDEGGVDEEGLFHLINAMRSTGGHVLLTGRRPPAAWPLQLPDLVSRLRAATLAEIEAPDDTLLAAVIVKLFADRQVEVEAHVVAYMLTRMDRSLAEAMRLVLRLDAMSLERQCRITRALAAEALAGE